MWKTNPRQILHRVVPAMDAHFGNSRVHEDVQTGPSLMVTWFSADSRRKLTDQLIACT